MTEFPFFFFFFFSLSSHGRDGLPELESSSGRYIRNLTSCKILTHRKRFGHPFVYSFSSVDDDRRGFVRNREKMSCLTTSNGM